MSIILNKRWQGTQYQQKGCDELSVLPLTARSQRYLAPIEVVTTSSELAPVAKFLLGEISPAIDVAVGEKYDQETCRCNYLEGGKLPREP